MTTTRVQILRGPSSDRLAFTPLSGELVQDTSNSFLYIGDGITPGGVLAAPLAASTNKTIIIVRNESGAPIPAGTPVIFSGFSGALPLISLGDYTSRALSDIIGVTEFTIANNANGSLVISGEVNNVNTAAFTAGDILYLGAGGSFTNVKPVEPFFITVIGNVERADAINGNILVQVADPVDIPNLPANNVFVGQAGGNPIATPLIAANITNTPAGNISATNVQAAINELDSEKQPIDADLTALAALATTGLIARTSAGTVATRTITGTALNISVANGDGVAGNPTLDLINAGTAGTYGSASQVPVFTTDIKGRVTNVVNTAILITASQVSDFAATVRSTVLTGLSLATSQVIAAGDSILQAFGYLQAQITRLYQPATTAALATGTITTTSTTDVLATGMTITPEAGTYQVIAATTVATSASGSSLFTSIYSGGTQVAASQLQAIPTFPSGGGLGAGTSAIVIPMTCIAEVTVNGSQAIELRWRVTAGTGSMGNRTINIKKIIRGAT